jgi:hypothetical protein
VHIPSLQGFSCDVLVAANMSTFPQDGSASQVVSHQLQLQSALAALRVEHRPHMAALAEDTLHFMAQQSSDARAAARLLKLWGLLNVPTSAKITSYLLEVIAVQMAEGRATVNLAVTLHSALTFIASAPSVVRIARVWVSPAAA